MLLTMCLISPALLPIHHHCTSSHYSVKLINSKRTIIESILTTLHHRVRFAGATVRDKQRLQRIVRSAEEVIGRSLPSMQDLYVARARAGWASSQPTPLDLHMGLFQTYIPLGRETAYHQD
uniref:Uncharacterized protein n=1 Tax=Knipowitschia caucasica TaxID=637954 RepID=A0AAV2MRH1_KNICA